MGRSIERQELRERGDKHIGPCLNGRGLGYVTHGLRPPFSLITRYYDTPPKHLVTPKAATSNSATVLRRKLMTGPP